jgi:hypothetical protein
VDQLSARQLIIGDTTGALEGIRAALVNRCK